MDVEEATVAPSIGELALVNTLDFRVCRVSITRPLPLLPHGLEQLLPRPARWQQRRCRRTTATSAGRHPGRRPPPPPPASGSASGRLPRLRPQPQRLPLTPPVEPLPPSRRHPRRRPLSTADPFCYSPAAAAAPSPAYCLLTLPAASPLKTTTPYGVCRAPAFHITTVQGLRRRTEAVPSTRRCSERKNAASSWWGVCGAAGRGCWRVEWPAAVAAGRHSTQAKV